MSSTAPTGDAVEIVTRFLRLIEERRLDEASSYLAEGAAIVFPGGRRFHTLEDQVASSAGRFQSVCKIFETIDELDSDQGVVVYVSGELTGVDMAGRSFSGVRFIDRFTVVDGLITDQRVWNDVAEVLPIGRRDDRGMS